MLIDAREVPSGSVIDTDVCVIGSGPAGLTLALALEEARLGVVLLERGGAPGRPLGALDDAVSPASGDFEAPPRFSPRFGGNANEWLVRLPWQARGVRLLPLSPIDFERRAWVPFSGWPISFDDLAPYYRQAHQRLRLGAFDYRPTTWNDASSPMLDLEAGGFTTHMEIFGRPSTWTQEAWRRSQRSRHVRVYIHASAGSLEGPPERVEHLAVDSLQRGRLQVRAKAYVLAGGGIENPQLLLSSANGRGFGNEHGVVGRYFMEHLRVLAGLWYPSDRTIFDRTALYDLRQRGAQLVMGKVVPTEPTMRERQLLNSAARFLPQPPPAFRHSLAALRELPRSIRGRDFVRALQQAGSAAPGLRYAALLGLELAFRQRRIVPHIDGGWSGLRAKAARFDAFMIEQQIEQAPHPDNRVRLGTRLDAFGRPSAALDWRWSEIDLESLRETQRLLAAALRETGRFDRPAEEWPALTTPGGAFHPMGGTRMHDDSALGVVDANSRVHGVSNLFVAGSSVFTTGGYANPTLTIVALALRLAEHLRRDLAPAVVEQAAAIDAHPGSPGLRSR